MEMYRGTKIDYKMVDKSSWGGEKGEKRITKPLQSKEKIISEQREPFAIKNFNFRSQLALKIFEIVRKYEEFGEGEEQFSLLSHSLFSQSLSI